MAMGIIEKSDTGTLVATYVASPSSTGNERIDVIVCLASSHADQWSPV